MENVVSLRERKKLQVQKSIVDVAMTMFNQKGFEETTIAEIMKSADLGTGTFYNYFLSKEDILKYVFREELDEAQVVLTELEKAKLRPAQKIFQVGVLIEKLFREKQQLFELYMQYYRDQSMAAKQPPHGPLFKDIFAQIIREGQENGDFRSDIPLEIIMEVFMGMIKSTLTSSLSMSFPENLKLKLELFLTALEKYDI